MQMKSKLFGHSLTELKLKELLKRLARQLKILRVTQFIRSKFWKIEFYNLLGNIKFWELSIRGEFFILGLSYNDYVAKMPERNQE